MKNKRREKIISKIALDAIIHIKCSNNKLKRKYYTCMYCEESS